MVRKLLILVTFLILFLSPMATWAFPVDNVDFSYESKTTAVVFLNPIFRNQTAFDIIKKGLSEKFSNADIIYVGDGQAKSPAFLEFMEKVQTDPVNDKGIILIKEEYLHKLGQDTKSKYIIVLNLGVTDYNRYGDYWSKLLLTAYDVDEKRPIAIDIWRKGKTRRPSKGAEYYMTKLHNEFTWPITTTTAEAVPDDSAKPAVIVFLPNEVLEHPELVQKIRTTVAGKFKVSSVPIYIDDNPKSLAFVELVNKVNADSAKQNTIIVRKEYLSEYGKQTKSSPVIAIKIGVVDQDVSWTGTWAYRYNEEILVIDPATNTYLSSSAFDTESKQRTYESVNILMDKLQTQFIWP